MALIHTPTTAIRNSAFDINQNVFHNKLMMRSPQQSPGGSTLHKFPSIRENLAKKIT
jgi:hypothetical protein